MNIFSVTWFLWFACLCLLRSRWSSVGPHLVCVCDCVCACLSTRHIQTWGFNNKGSLWLISPSQPTNQLANQPVRPASLLIGWWGYLMWSDLAAEETLITQLAFLCEVGLKIAFYRLRPDFWVVVVAVGLQTLCTRFPFLESHYCNQIEWNVVFQTVWKCSVLFMPPPPSHILAVAFFGQRVLDFCYK